MQIPLQLPEEADCVLVCNTVLVVCCHKCSIVIGVVHTIRSSMYATIHSWDVVKKVACTYIYYCKSAKDDCKPREARWLSTNVHLCYSSA
jgi:hypothetical protein